MNHQHIQIQIFVSCPGDVEKEKIVVKKICEKINRLLQELDCNVFLLVKDWREIVGRYGERPQSIINDTFTDYDIYLGILHMRFGSPTQAINPATDEDFGSGTVEEFTLAFKRWKDNHDAVQVYMFFKNPGAPANTDATKELLKVQQFKDEISATGWVNPFADTDEFKDKVDAVLTAYAFKLCHKRKGFLKTETLDNLSQDKDQPVSITDFSKEIDLETVKRYIPRTVSSYKKMLPGRRFLFTRDIEEDETLKKVIEKNKRVVLIGNAGSGKSTELAKLVLDCQNALIPFIPVYKRFNSYVEQEIGSFLPDGWEKIPPSTCLLVLDGLDEIQPQHFYTAIRKIQAFADKNSKVAIIVSCRTNFYELPEAGSTSTLDGFEIYFIDDINIKNIDEYAALQSSIDVTKFIRESFEEGYQDLIGKPFFLNLLLDAYRANHTLVGGRQQLFERILQSRIQLDERHFKTSIQLATRRKKIVTALERIALVMEAMGTNIVSFETLEEILPGEQLLLLQYYPGFAKTKTNDRLWSFEHNNIQEYLAARALSSQIFEKIQGFIAIPPAYRKIKLRWSNTLSFLISIVDNPVLLQVLLDWLIEIEPEIIVKFEPDRIPASVRMHIFKQIFDKAKQRGIWLRSNKFSEKELAYFSESPETFDFLIREIENTTGSRVVIINCLHLLKYYRLNLPQNSLLLSVIYQLFDRFPADYELIHSTLYLIRDLFNGDEEVVDTLMLKLGSYTNQYVRAGLYGLLADSRFVNKYVDYLIEGITISQNDEMEQRSDVMLADESWNLKRAIEKVNNAPALEKVLLYFTNPDDRRHINYFDKPEVIRKLIENASEVYQTDPSIYNSVLQFFSSHGRYSRKGTLELIQPFFDSTGTRLRAFMDIWKRAVDNEKLYEKRILLLNITDKAALDYVLQEYAKHNATNDEISQLYNDLTHYRLDSEEDKTLADYFEKKIALETSAYIAKPPAVDYAERHRQRNQQSFDLLFDRDTFEKELEHFYQEMGQQAVTFNDLWEFTKDNHISDAEDFFPRCVLDLLRDWARNDDTLTLDKVTYWLLKGDHFADYSMEHVYEHLKNYKEIEVSPAQLTHIEAWCNQAVSKLDTKQMITAHDEQRSFTLDGIARLIWFFLRRLDINLPKNKLLDFTLFVDVDRRDGDPTELTMLQKYLAKEEIDKRVIENLSEEIGFSIAWKNNAVYALANDLSRAYPGIIKGIKDESKYMNDRLEITKAFFAKTHDNAALKNILQTTNITELTWLVVDLWMRNNLDNDYLLGFLKPVMQRQSLIQEYVLRAAEILIELQDREAFYFYTDLILQNRINDRNFPRRLNIIAQVTNVDMVPRLMELLSYSKRLEFMDDHFRMFDNVVLSALTSVAMYSDANFETVIVALRKFVEDNQQIKNINFMHMSIEKIEFDFYTKKSQLLTLSEVIAEVDTIRPLT